VFGSALFKLPALLALRVLDGRLGFRRGLHVLRYYRARQVEPKPTRLVRLLLVLGWYLLLRDLIPILYGVKQDVSLARLATTRA
jgi:hypothetical protein